jgi:hypothetical protein
LPVIDPNNDYITIFQILNSIITLILVFCVQVRWGFIYEEKKVDFVNFWKMTCFIFYCVEVLINLNVGYYKMGMLVKERQLILKDYKARNMFFDFLVLFSLLFTIFKDTNSIDVIVIDQFIHLKLISFWKNKIILEEKLLKD